MFEMGDKKGKLTTKMRAQGHKKKHNLMVNSEFRVGLILKRGEHDHFASPLIHPEA